MGDFWLKDRKEEELEVAGQEGEVNGTCVRIYDSTGALINFKLPILHHICCCDLFSIHSFVRSFTFHVTYVNYITNLLQLSPRLGEP